MVSWVGECLGTNLSRIRSVSSQHLVPRDPGATFVSSLIENGLIDELNLFVNPVAIGKGMRIFAVRRPLKLTSSTAYPCGVVVDTYAPR